MTYAERNYQSADGLKLYYRDYDGAGATGVPALCLPGLTRNSRDFEELAAHLAKGRRVLAPDFRGRGYSAYDPNYMNYQPVTYAGDLVPLFQDAGLARAIFIGTSLGGLVSMMAAAANPAAVAAIVLNDIGPEVAPEGVARIATYAGKMPEVRSWEDAAAAIRTVNEFAHPHLNDEDWMRIARRTYREGPDGMPVVDYDPNIGKALREAGPVDADPAEAAEGGGHLWPVFAAIAPTIPVLVIRGETSDILSAQTLEKMRELRPTLKSVTLPDIGHAPTLDEPEAVKAIETFAAEVDQINP